MIRKSIQTRCSATREGTHRHGATTIEACVSVLMLLSVLFSMLDLGLLVFQSNLLALSARQVARDAIVRGSAIDPSYAWGPNACSGNAGDGTAIAQAVAPYCVTLAKSTVKYQVTWPDGNNRIDNRVTVNLTCQRTAMTPLTSWMGPIKLQSSCTMNIIH